MRLSLPDGLTPIRMDVYDRADRASSFLVLYSLITFPFTLGRASTYDHSADYGLLG